MDLITQFVILLVLALMVVFNFADKSKKTAELENPLEYYYTEEDIEYEKGIEYKEDPSESEDED